MMMVIVFQLKTDHLTKKGKVSINIADYFQHILERLQLRLESYYLVLFLT